tara:strand:+ start:2912 stop:3619 length:708 start_codon:yes stop_codon:yes gene_type:complete
MKYIALDFDGTLTDENHIIDLEALWSATMIQRMGIDVFMVSGRTAYEMYFLAKHTGLKTIVVGENGGVVIENSPSNIIKLANKKVPLKAFEVISNKINVEELLTIPRLTEVVLKRTFDLNDAINIIKNENIDVDLMDSKYSYHITEKGMNKAKGFSYITNKLNINLDDCIAIGDSNTDIPLFDICGYSITMNHAENNVKEKADFITKNERAKGAIEAFKHVADKFLKKNIDDVKN